MKLLRERIMYRNPEPPPFERALCPPKAYCHDDSLEPLSLIEALTL